MVQNVTFSNSILESLGVLSSFNISETIWEKYEMFAIAKIKESTIKLRGTQFYLKDLTHTQASKELLTIGPILQVLSKFKTIIEQIENREYKEFKMVALEFFNTVDFLVSNIQEIADIHSSYKLSENVLSIDWDKEEDEHWNNY